MAQNHLSTPGREGAYLRETLRTGLGIVLGQAGRKSRSAVLENGPQQPLHIRCVEQRLRPFRKAQADMAVVMARQVHYQKAAIPGDVP